MTASELFNRARTSYRDARGSYDEALEALVGIKVLAERALSNLLKALDSLKAIVATADNGIRSHEAANEALNTARVSIEKARETIKKSEVEDVV